MLFSDEGAADCGEYCEVAGGIEAALEDERQT
jgi:hypothetical protein